MIRFGHFLTVFLLVTASHAQELDTASIGRLGSVKDSVQSILIQKTALAQRHQAGKLDSLQALANVSRFTDSLKINGWSDSLRRKIEGRFSPQRITRKLDSLRSFNLSADRITNFSDSLLRKKEGLLGEVGGKQQALQKKIAGRYDTWLKGVRDKFNLDSAGIKPPVLDPTLTDPIKGLIIPNSTLPNTSSIPVTNLPSGLLPEVPGIPALNTGDFSSLGLTDDLSAVGGSLAVPSNDQLAGWNASMPSMPDPKKTFNGQLAEVKALTTDPGAVVEKAVGQLGEMNDVTKAMSEADKLKEQNEALKLAEQMRNPEALKEQAVNHFAGQEAAIQGAMSQMSKYKKKYASLGSLSEIKKNDWLPRNGLKGKPFRERFRIGLHTGPKVAGDTLLLDFYPNASYRITGRLEAGLGAIYRVRLNTQTFSFDQHDPVWGISTFAVVKTFNFVFLRFEVDGNSFPKSGPPSSVPISTGTSAGGPDKPATRDWRWTFHSGIQTNFKLGKQWTCNIQMLYNFDTNLKDGFPERLKARVGVQYKLKARAGR